MDRADADRAGSFGLREGEGEFLQPLGLDVADGRVEPPAAAEQDGEQGEEEGAQHVLQTQVSHRACGAGMGGALRPAAVECLH